MSTTETLDGWIKSHYRALTVNPRLHALCCPRRLSPPGGMQSPTLVGGYLYSLLGPGYLKTEEQHFRFPIEANIQNLAYQVVNQDVPVYYVAEGFLRAVAATKMPNDAQIDELKWPRDAMVLMLPPAFMREYLGCDIGPVLASRITGGVNRCDKFQAPEILVPLDKVSWCYYAGDAVGVRTYASSYWCKDTIGATDSSTAYPYTDYMTSGALKSVNGAEITTKMSALLFRLLCVLTFRDNLIDHAVIERPASVTPKHGPRPAIWTANKIGYRYKLEQPVRGGTHASPSMHVRERHWAYVAVGKRADLVPMSAMPVGADNEIDWSKVNPETAEKFKRTHRRTWIDTIYVLGQKHD
jgi:hypothetical protein